MSRLQSLYEKLPAEELTGIDTIKSSSKKKFLPFAKRCKLTCPGTIVQEDNAPSHAHKHQGKVYQLWDIMKLLWLSNSPDLNAIEPCWFWIKKRTTRKGIASGVVLKSSVVISLNLIDQFCYMQQTDQFEGRCDDGGERLNK
jgi:hypothetical protein